MKAVDAVEAIKTAEVLRPGKSTEDFRAIQVLKFFALF